MSGNGVTRRSAEKAPPTLELVLKRNSVERVVEGLIAAGLPPETPTAAISHGTLADQEVARTTLRHFASATIGLAGPALLVIGDVAALDVLASAHVPTLALTATTR